MKRRGLTLLEVLLAAVLLAAIAVACLPLLRPPSNAPLIQRNAALDEIAGNTNELPPADSVAEFDASIGERTEGRWRVIVTDNRYGIAWIQSTDQDQVSP
ncbi:MAG: prepilin-type N-terminal cleavage/methylation domain-containing protein [Planctomycetota bacterium]